MHKKLQQRIHDLRELGASERQYRVSTPFDGQPLEFLTDLGDGEEERVAQISFNSEDDNYQSQFYGGLFETNGTEYVDRCQVKKHRFIGDYSWMGEYIKTEVGNPNLHLPIDQMINGRNMEAHLLRNPVNDLITHVFFLPSRAYLNELKQKEDGD